MGVSTRFFENGRVAFPDLIVAVAGQGHRLHFSLLSPSTGRPVQAVSEPFNVEPAEPAELVFRQHPPSDIAAGTIFTVEVNLIDMHGNAAPGSHRIELSAWKNDSAVSALLGPTVTETDPDSGAAIFDGVAFRSVKGLVFLRV